MWGGVDGDVERGLFCSESLAIEKPSALFPFLNHLATTSGEPTYHLGDNLQKTLDYSLSAAEPSVGAVDWSALSPSQAYANLHASLNATGLVSDAERASLDASLAAREGAVAIESFRQLELQRRAVVKPSSWAEERGGECEGWVEVGGAQACTVDELWEVIGLDQQDTNTPIKVSPGSVPL